MEKFPENWGVGEWSTGKDPEDFEKLAEKQSDKEAIEEQNKTIASINRHLGIENKGLTETEKQTEELPEKEIEKEKLQEELNGVNKQLEEWETREDLSDKDKKIVESLRNDKITLIDQISKLEESY